VTIRHAIWRVGAAPEPLQPAVLTSEAQLEDMIVAAPSILHDNWMLIGRQVDTGFGGKLDLLAIAPDGALVLIELKRDRTPRDVIAQAIDYATFVADLQADEIAAIYTKFKSNGDLGADFQARFGQKLDEATLNATHQIVVVAASIDASTTRIVRYLNDRDIAINVLYFQVFANGADRLLSRAWLIDPGETQIKVTQSKEGPNEPWNGELYASFGHGPSRSWPEAMRHGFISAGGGAWYSNSLNLLAPGDRIWVKAPKYGFVGVGKAKGKLVPAQEFTLPTPEADRPALEVLHEATPITGAKPMTRSGRSISCRWTGSRPGRCRFRGGAGQAEEAAGGDHRGAERPVWGRSDGGRHGVVLRGGRAEDDGVGCPAKSGCGEHERAVRPFPGATG